MSVDPFASNRAAISPEQRLFRGVIVNAAFEAAGSSPVQDRSGEKERAQRSALVWFERSNEDFETVCSLAGLNPNFVRRKVLAFIERAALDPSLSNRKAALRAN